MCLLRNSKGDVVRDADGSATYVEIEKLVNLNNTTSQPYQTVAPNRNRNTLQAFSFKYSSKHKTKVKENKIELFNKENKTYKIIPESKLVWTDNFILLAENQVGAYNGSNLDIFYNVKLLAMEKQLNNLLAILVFKLNEIEDFLLSKSDMKDIFNKSSREKLVYRTLFKAVEDEQDLTFWKVDNIVNYDYKKMLNNNLEYSKNLLNKAIKEQRQLTDAKLTVEEVKKHYESNENKNKYEKLLLEDKKKQKQKYEKMLLKDQQKRKNEGSEDSKERKKKRLVTYQF